jgi:AcrR family transcriptional regulator
MKKKSGPPKKINRGGRPSQTASEQIRAEILDAAARLFLSEGYGAVSIEAIAKSCGISKRTFYARFADKAALFAAVAERLVGRMRPAGDAAELFTGGTLEDILRRLAKIIVLAVVTPEAIALHRLMVAETRRFPEIAAIMEREGSRHEAITRIADLLKQHGAASQAEFAAEQFLQMIVSVPQHRALGLGAPMTRAELMTWADSSVQLFLRGYAQIN